MKAIVVNELVKVYGKNTALQGISFTVDEGEIFGLIGPNGAGKTTTLRIIATLLKPTKGSVSVLGHDVVKEPLEVRKKLSYLPEEAGAYPHMKGIEYLEFVASLYYDDPNEIRSSINEAIKLSGMGEALYNQIKTYSKGMKRRLQLARALMVKPRLAILDEPTSGIDVLHAVHLRKLIKKASKEYNITILLSSHNMLEVEHLCDRVALLIDGKIVIEGTPEDIKRETKTSNLEEAFSKVVQIA